MIPEIETIRRATKRAEREPNKGWLRFILKPIGEKIRATASEGGDCVAVQNPGRLDIEDDEQLDDINQDEYAVTLAAAVKSIEDKGYTVTLAECEDPDADPSRFEDQPISEVPLRFTITVHW